MWIRGNVIRNVFEAGLLWVEMFLRCIYQFAVVDEFCGEEQRSARWFCLLLSNEKHRFVRVGRA